MKRLGLLALGLLTVGIAWAAVTPANIDNGGRWSKVGVWIGTTATQTTQTNRVARVLFGSQQAQFYTDAGIGCTLPMDGGVASVPGAVVGDHCQVTMPALSAPGSLVDCSVLVADTAQLRHCAQQIGTDAGQLTYEIMVVGHGT